MSCHVCIVTSVEKIHSTNYKHNQSKKGEEKTLELAASIVCTSFFE